jgi:uncharacterized protein YqjF (DUF2071 family)
MRPDATVVMFQRWEHLLFLHWRWDVSAIQASLPPGLQVDTFNGEAWVGLVPLFMRHIRPPFLPAMGPLSNFLELNLRTYVYDALGRPGLYFYSLDCDQPLAVTGARLLDLRYEHAEMRASIEPDGTVAFEAQRLGTSERSSFRYREEGPRKRARPGSLEFFLIERYRLFASDDSTGALKTIRVHHAPYEIRGAQVDTWGEIALQQAGLGLPNRYPEHVCAADPLEVEVFVPESVSAP